MSKYRFGVLSALNERMKSPTELANELNLDLPHISKTLSQLSSKGYIVNKTPGFWKNKLFEITSHGKEALKNIEVMLT
ncbi:MAG: hypothetical protein FVQ82_08390 [Planctomycetes bacterium]|nr:hypothetical protein [Planctomycetota bacterium]